MKRSGIWYVCILAALPIVLAGPTCTCPVKALLAPDKVKKTAPASKPAATHISSKSAPRAAETPAPTSFDQAVSQARALNKPIYLEFSTKWCIPCRLYHKRVLSSERGQQALKGVVFFPVDADKDGELAGRFHVNAVPTGFLLKPQAAGSDVTILNRHVGPLSTPKLENFLSQGG